MKTITISEIRNMQHSEGLILQGCGGDLNDWVVGINEMLTEEGILQNGSTFTDISLFEHEGLTNLLFNLENVDLHIGKLAMWRIATHENFGGKWLSDYVVNRLGGFHNDQQAPENQKPDCPLIGQDGNIFNLLGIAAHTLKRNRLAKQSKEMQERVTSCSSYNDALNIMGEYVNITSVEEHSDGFEMRQR